jgi:hypothetical protein
MALFTFLVTPTIFGSQSRDAAGRIVGAIFPLYFRYGLVLTGIALMARFVAREAWPGARRLTGTALLAAAVALTAFQTYGLEPRMADVKRAFASFDRTPTEDPARKEFARLHGISMALNLLLILDGAVLVMSYDLFRSPPRAVCR